jgi:hypothetical protein
MRESKGGKPGRRNESDMGDAESTDYAATRTDLDPRVIGLSGSVSVRTRKVANYACIE